MYRMRSVFQTYVNKKRNVIVKFYIAFECIGQNISIYLINVFIISYL